MFTAFSRSGAAAAALAAITFASPLVFAQAQTFTGAATAKDGDDLVIGGVDVRLNGIDAPERGRRCTGADGQRVNVQVEATRALSRIASAGPITCTQVDHDRRGRPVAACTVAGRDVAAEMVAEGWAWDWPRFSRGRYAPQEAEARAARRGLWAINCPNLLGGRKLD